MKKHIPSDDEKDRARVRRWRWTNKERALQLDFAYRHMIEAARDLQLPKAFNDDLYYWDRLLLRNTLPREFAWIVRVCGTWLFRPPSRRDGCVAQIVRALHPNSSETPHFFWWDGQQLVEITQEEMLKRLLATWEEEHERKLVERVQQREEYYGPASRSPMDYRVAAKAADELIAAIWKERHE